VIPQRITLATVTGLAAALVLTACGGSDSDNAQNASAGRAAPRAVSNGLGQGGDAAAGAQDGYGPSASDAYGSDAAGDLGSSDAAAGAKTTFVTTAVKVQKTQNFGPVLEDSGQWTMYRFDQDKPGVSNCYDECQEKWPAILVQDAPDALRGVDRKLIGTYVRKNGQVGLTYAKWPMYRFAADAGKHQLKGTKVKGWHAVQPNGKRAVLCLPGMASTANKWLQTEDTTLGRVVVDGRKRTLYRFDMDRKGGPSACDPACQKKWPRLISPPGSEPKVRGLNAALVGKVRNADGTWSVTYDGWVMYYFDGDSKAGDVNGQAVGGVWWAIQPNGQRVKTAAGDAAGDAGAGGSGGYSSGGGGY
jgi:predicted lipoprotein with Yx(FWY)xxD motif